MKTVEYSFRINAFSPETFPMVRLGQYVADLGALLGEVNCVHFVGLRKGSTEIVHRVQADAVEKIEATLRRVQQCEADVVHLNAYRDLNRRLKEDGATASLIRQDSASVLLRFSGRDEPNAAPPDVLIQNGAIDGVVISLGGRDETVPVRIQNGDVIYRCTTSREIARLLGPHIFGDELRLIGEGKWLISPDGEWHLEHFRIITFELLDAAPLQDVVGGLRALGGFAEASGDLYAELQALRRED